MAKKSAGLLMYRRVDGILQVLIVHPGGPFWTKKDFGVWTIPKGEYLDDEEPLDAARREFHEETGFVAEGPFLPLGSTTLKSGKRVYAWAVEGEADVNLLQSNLFELEWPPRSGKTITVPEVDRAEWFFMQEAKAKLAEAQWPFLDALELLVGRQ